MAAFITANPTIIGEIQNSTLIRTGFLKNLFKVLPTIFGRTIFPVVEKISSYPEKSRNASKSYQAKLKSFVCGKI